MKKLLIVSPQNPYPPIDGGKIGIYYPLVYLSRYFKIYFICPISPLSYKDDICKAVEHLKSFGVEPFLILHNTSDSIVRVISNIFADEPFKWAKYFSRKILKTAEELIKAENIENCWISSPHMFKYGLYLKDKYDIKIFLREHNIEYELVRQFLNLNRNPAIKPIALWQYLKTKNLEKYYWSKADKTFFISDLDYKIATDTCPEASNKFEILYDGVEAGNYVNCDIEDKSIIYTADFKTIQNKKSFIWFIKNIWIKAYKELCNFKLYVTGNHEGLIERVLNMSEKELKHLNIIDLGFVEDINSVLSSKKYVLSPTIIGSGIRLKLISGMDLGKVCFCTPLDIQTCPHFMDMENLVLFSSSGEFLTKIKIIEESNELYGNIGEKARELIRMHFSWDAYAEMAAEKLKDIIK